MFRETRNCYKNNRLVVVSTSSEIHKSVMLSSFFPGHGHGGADGENQHCKYD